MSHGAPSEPPGSSAGPSGAAPAHSGPESHLRALQERVASGNADLYRHLALYLQVLREVLPVRVERADFPLATQVQPRRYAVLLPDDRQQLHRRLRALVHRCRSLLTVEQLVSLAAQMGRERERQERRERQRLLQRFSDPSGDGEGDGESLGLTPPNLRLPIPSGAAGGHGVGRAGPEDLPKGSVNLDGSRPFSISLLQSLTSAIPSGPFSASAEPPAAADRQGLADLAQEGGEAEEADDLADGAQESDGGDDSMGADIEAEMERDIDEQENGSDEGGQTEDDLALPHPASLAGMHLPQLLHQLMGDQPRRASATDPWKDARLPDDPLVLLRWLDGVEQALARRLRNLSHAINVELLRTGLSGSLLPVSLLDGVLSGQIEVQPAPPNLLRLQLPFPAEDASPLLVMAVLLRRVDLELEEPRLRTCRRRLQQHRQEVRRMAQQFRRLQRRREAHEAEQLWLQDRHTSLSPLE